MVRTQTLKVKDHERHLKKVEELVQQKLSRQLPEDDNVFETIKGAGVWGAVEITVYSDYQWVMAMTPTSWDMLG